MRSRATARFRRLLDELPEATRRAAQQSFALFKDNPSHPSLQFKRVKERPELYSARVSLTCRALAQREGDSLIWFWLGSHDEYERLIAR